MKLSLKTFLLGGAIFASVIQHSSALVTETLDNFASVSKARTKFRNEGRVFSHIENNTDQEINIRLCYAIAATQKDAPPINKEEKGIVIPAQKSILFSPDEKEAKILYSITSIHLSGIEEPYVESNEKLSCRILLRDVSFTEKEPTSRNERWSSLVLNIKK